MILKSNVSIHLYKNCFLEGSYDIVKQDKTRNHLPRRDKNKAREPVTITLHNTKQETSYHGVTRKGEPITMARHKTNKITSKHVVPQPESREPVSIVRHRQATSYRGKTQNKTREPVSMLRHKKGTSNRGKTQKQGKQLFWYNTKQSKRNRNHGVTQKKETSNRCETQNITREPVTM